MSDEVNKQVFKRLCHLVHNKTEVEITLTNGDVINGVLNAFSWNPLVLSVVGNSRHLVNWRYVVELRYPKERGGLNET
jgi:sRNA-binding regulator protein Hfq